MRKYFFMAGVGCSADTSAGFAAVFVCLRSVRRRAKPQRKKGADRIGRWPMAETGAALLRRWFEVVWNERREDLMEELASPNVVTHGVSGPKDVTRGLG